MISCMNQVQSLKLAQLLLLLTDKGKGFFGGGRGMGLNSIQVAERK